MTTTAVETDWAGTHVYAARVLPVRDAGEVLAAVRARDRVRALGTRHTFNGLADTPGGVLLDLTGLPADIAIDPDARTVSVGAGTSFGELARTIDAQGWALHNLGSLPHISVGGAVATGTHGSGDRLGALATAVRSIEIVDGAVRTVHRGEPDFDAVVVALGAAGIVTRLTLAVEPTYEVRQDVYRGLGWTALDDWDAVTGAGDSVSVFTTWTSDVLGDVWVKRRLPVDPVPDTVLDARRDEHSRDEITPEIRGNVTEQGGSPGPWWARLPHFRADTVPSNGDEIQSEWFVDRADGPAAIAAVRAVAEEFRAYLVVSELRTVAADELWLSGAYGRDTCALHFTWARVPEVASMCVPLIEDVLAPFDARPHWGKVHGQDAARLAAVHPRLADARALFDRLDPSGRFSSPLLRALGVRSPGCTSSTTNPGPDCP